MAAIFCRASLWRIALTNADWCKLVAVGRALKGLENDTGYSSSQNSRCADFFPDSLTWRRRISRHSWHICSFADPLDYGHDPVRHQYVKQSPRRKAEIRRAISDLSKASDPKLELPTMNYRKTRPYPPEPIGSA